jgi:hypothetical protein
MLHRDIPASATSAVKTSPSTMPSVNFLLPIATSPSVRVQPDMQAARDSDQRQQPAAELSHNREVPDDGKFFQGV